MATFHNSTVAREVLARTFGEARAASLVLHGRHDGARVQVRVAAANLDLKVVAINGHLHHPELVGCCALHDREGAE